MSDMRGKLNGSVATRNKGGAALRTKVTPINPRTSAQSLQRAYTSDISKAWGGTLTDAHRNSWDTFGQSAGAKNIFGNGIILSGIAAYQKVNRIILACGGSRIDTAPPNKEVPSILGLALTANHVGPALSVTFNPAPLVGTQGLYVFATPPVSPGIKNLSSQLRLIGFFATAASPLDILAAWEAVFGTFPTVAGARIGITAQIVDTSTGAISAASGTGTLIT